MRLRMLFAVGLLAACAPPQVDESEAAIVGGSTDTGDPSVVLVFGRSAVRDNTCTGTVIAPHLVLTAAHCVEDLNYRISVGTASVYDFTPGHDDPAALLPVASSLIAPGYDTSVTPHLHDIAILHVNANLGTPLPYHAGAPDFSWIGQPVRIVGYGITGSKLDDANTRRSATTVFFDILENELAVDNGTQPCHGDSGGPAFLTLNGISTIVGVSSASNADCHSMGYYGRIDRDLTFINGVVAGNSGGGSPGASAFGGVHATTGGCQVAPGSQGGAASLLLVVVAVGLARRPRRRLV